jgi:hypothetical protein
MSYLLYYDLTKPGIVAWDCLHAIRCTSFYLSYELTDRGPMLHQFTIIERVTLDHGVTRRPKATPFKLTID